MNIAIYPRKSKYSDSSDSISNQIESCKEFINRCYGEDNSIFIYKGDEGFSGGNTDRPGYQKMLEDIEAGRIDMVVCYMIDRISRNIADFCSFYSVLSDKGCRFVSVKEQIDDSTAMGRAMLYICQVFANLERDNIRERITDNLSYLASEGYWFSGSAPFGYKTEKIIEKGKRHSVLVKDENTADFYYMLVNMFESGKSLCGMQTYFKNNNIRTPKGGFIGTSVLHTILSNPIYASNDSALYDYFTALGSNIPYDRDEFDGENGITIGGRKRTKSSSGTKPDCWTIYIGRHQALISGERWVAMQMRFGDNLMFKKRKHDIGLLRGVLRCKCCGNTMSVSCRTLKDTGNIGGHYYCNLHKQRGNEYCKMGQISVNTIDSEITNFIESIALDDSILDKYSLPDDNIRDDNTQAEIKYIEKSIKSVRDKINNLTDMIAESGSAAKYLLEKVAELDKQLSELESKHSSLLMDAFINREKAPQKIDISKQCKRFLSEFNTLSYAEKNNIIKSIFKVLYVDRTGNIQIDRENLNI